LYLLASLFLCAIPLAVCNLVSKTSFPTADYPVNAPFHDLGLASSSKKKNWEFADGLSMRKLQSLDPVQKETLNYWAKV